MSQSDHEIAEIGIADVGPDGSKALGSAHAPADLTPRRSTSMRGCCGAPDTDFGHLEPMVKAAERELAAADVRETPCVALADAGYWHTEQMQNIISCGTQVPPETPETWRDKPLRDTLARQHGNVANLKMSGP